MDQPQDVAAAPAAADDTQELPALDLNQFDVALADGPPPPLVELVPMAPPPIDPAQMDVTLTTDPLPQMELLRRSRWRWKFLALVGGIGFAIVAVVSAVQFAGSFYAVKLLHQARQQAEQTREETARALEENRKIYADLVNERREVLVLRGQLSQVQVQWEAVRDEYRDATERLVGREDRRQLIYDMMAKEADRLTTEIRRVGDDYAALLEGIIHEGYHGETANPLVPRTPKSPVED